MMDLIYITDKPEEVEIACEAGISFIMIDLEHIGKAKRQPNMNTRISNHSFSSLAAIQKIIGTCQSSLIVRCNSLDVISRSEIRDINNSDAEFIMVPMIRSETDIKQAYSLLGRSKKLIFLLETATSYVYRDNIMSELKESDICYLGLNDMSIEFNLRHMMDLYKYEIVKDFASTFNKWGIRFGVGGIGIPKKEYTLSVNDIISYQKGYNSTLSILTRDWSNIIYGDEFTLGINELRRLWENAPAWTT